jgi:hypothetical protein
MINPFKDVNWNPDINERKKFGKTLIIGFPVLSIVLLLLGWITSGSLNKNLEIACWIFCVGVALGLVSYFLPQFSKPIYQTWYFVGCCLGFVISNLLFSLMFFLVITPIGLIRRIFSKDSFPKTFDKSKKTYWNDAEQTDDMARYYKQF